MGLEEHRQKAARAIRCQVITISDTRTVADDESGALIRKLLEEAGHRVLRQVIVRDDAVAIRGAVLAGVQDQEVQAILTNGGTGISTRDTTFETVEGLLEKRLPGFGELFRYLSYGEIGSAALLSRATAGVVKGRVVISMPGSSGAVRLAMSRLVLPELGHMVSEVNK